MDKLSIIISRVDNTLVFGETWHCEHRLSVILGDLVAAATPPTQKVFSMPLSLIPIAVCIYKHFLTLEIVWKLFVCITVFF